MLQWHIKSTSKAQQGLYEYDAVSRLRDVKGRLWEAFDSLVQPVLLIDELDKADTSFPTTCCANSTARPIIIITNNNERELPDAFLRRCFFHYIRFRDEVTMRLLGLGTRLPLRLPSHRLRRRRFHNSRRGVLTYGCRRRICAQT
jgi:MoxR-like ATPase